MKYELTSAQVDSMNKLFEKYEFFLNNPCGYPRWQQFLLENGGFKWDDTRERYCVIVENQELFTLLLLRI